jgi:preprotein translocase subunit SecG
MISFLIGLCTVLMVIVCILLVFLVLLQLPKKEAGVGMAFGGAATDALFGAGSGNVLTKITKYFAGAFFALALIMAVLSAHRNPSGAASLQEELQKKGPAAPISALPPSSTSPTPSTIPPANGLLQTPPVSNAPATGTNK